jgi:hypothetical protein
MNAKLTRSSGAKPDYLGSIRILLGMLFIMPYIIGKDVAGAGRKTSDFYSLVKRA